MTTVWLLSMYFTWVTPASRQVDNIPPKIECISMAEEFIEAAQLTKGYLVNYTGWDNTKSGDDPSRLPNRLILPSTKRLNSMRNLFSDCLALVLPRVWMAKSRLGISATC